MKPKKQKTIKKDLFDTFGIKAYFMLLAFGGFLISWLIIVGGYLTDFIESIYKCAEVNIWSCGFGVIPIITLVVVVFCAGLWISLTLCLPLLKRWEEEIKRTKNEKESKNN